MRDVEHASEMFELALRVIDDAGAHLDSRVGGCEEVLGASFTMSNPRANFVWHEARKASPIYAAGEMLWYLTGRDDGEQIAFYAPSYRDLLSTDGTAFGAYGARMNDQVPCLLEMLKQDPNTRQGIITLWRPTDIYEAATRRQKDLPCTLSLQFFVRHGALHLIVTMRSNDVWKGLPYDVFCFTTLQIIFADCLRLTVGDYVHQVGSLHLYDKNAEGAQGCIKEQAPLYSHVAVSPSFQPCIPEQIQIATGIEAEVRTGRIADPFHRMAVHGMQGTVIGQLVALAAMQAMTPADIDSKESFFLTYVNPSLYHRALTIRREQKR